MSRTEAGSSARNSAEFPATARRGASRRSRPAIDSSHVETTLGTITTRGRNGSGSLNFDSRRGTPIPTGDLAGLSGTTIEVRNTSGTTVLTGQFPSIP